MRNRNKQGNRRPGVPPPMPGADGNRTRRMQLIETIAEERKVEPPGKRLEEDEALRLFKARPKVKPTLTHVKYDPRRADSYRGAKRNAARGPRAQKGDVEVHGPPGEPKAFAWVQPWKGPHPPKPKNWWKRSA
jgi:hypothetical protein